MKFYHNGITLEVPEGIYYPREDSMLLAEFLESMELKGKSCLEVGCGSGFLSILMAKSGAVVTAVDVSSQAVETAKKNADINGINLHFAVSDLFSNIDSKFDLIVFNSPYLPKDEYSDITYSGGIEIVERFISSASAHLKEGGKILLLISSLTGEKEVLDIFAKNGFKAKIIKRKRIFFEELMIVEARN